MVQVSLIIIYSTEFPPAHGGRGVPWGKDRRGEGKGDRTMRRDRNERGEREKNYKNSVRFSETLQLGPQPGERLSLAVPCNGTGDLWWMALRSSTSWRTAMAPPVEDSRQLLPRSMLLPKHGGWQQAPASW